MKDAIPNLLTGARLRLTAGVAADRAAEARWSRDSEFRRFQDDAIARPQSPRLEADEDGGSNDTRRYGFMLRRLGSDEAIGFAALWPNWPQRDAWLSIGIGDRAYWGQGYGAEALRLIMRYGFLELNLQRLSLTVLESNARGIHAYEKAGFVFEGLLREYSRYDGRRYGEVFMGILRTEWEAARKGGGQAGAGTERM